MNDKMMNEICQRSSLLFVSTLHTSASLSLSTPIAENLEPYLNRIVPSHWNREFFTHTYEGDDDMPGHLKSSICGVNFAVPSVFLKTKIAAIQLNEHRDCGGWGGGHTRKISLLGLKSSLSNVISNVLTGEISEILCEYVKKVKFESEKCSGILVVSVRSREYISQEKIQKKKSYFKHSKYSRLKKTKTGPES